MKEKTCNYEDVLHPNSVSFNYLEISEQLSSVIKTLKNIYLAMNYLCKKAPELRGAVIIINLQTSI